MCLDDTLIRTDRVAARTERGNHSWYSGKHNAFGGNVQVITDHSGFPVWVSPVEPGSTHDLIAARAHALPALYKAASQGLRTLADKGYQGAGTGVLTPVKGTSPCPDDATYNHLHTALRSPAERTNAMLKQFKALQRVTLDPKAITHITATALVIINLNKQPRRERLDVPPGAISADMLQMTGEELALLLLAQRRARRPELPEAPGMPATAPLA